MIDVIAGLAVVASVLAIGVIAVTGQSLDVPYTILGFGAVGMLFIAWAWVNNHAPNPYPAPLFKVKFPDYIVWRTQQREATPATFRDGDLVRVISRIPGSFGPNTLYNVVEPNRQQEAIIPGRLLTPASNLDAWWYHKLYQRKRGKMTESEAR